MDRQACSGFERRVRRHAELLFRPLLGTPGPEASVGAPSRRSLGTTPRTTPAAVFRPPSTSPRPLKSPRNAIRKYYLPSLFSLQRMAGFFVEFVLQPQTLAVRLHGAKRGYELAGPFPHVELAKFRGRGRAFTRIMIWKACVPPDAGIERVGQIQPLLIRAGFLFRAIQVN